MGLTNKRPRSCMVVEESDSKMSTSGPYGMPSIFYQQDVMGEATE